MVENGFKAQVWEMKYNFRRCMTAFRGSSSPYRKRKWSAVVDGVGGVRDKACLVPTALVNNLLFCRHGTDVLHFTRAEISV